MPGNVTPFKVRSPGRGQTGAAMQRMPTRFPALAATLCAIALAWIPPSAAHAAGCTPEVDAARWQMAEVEGTPARLQSYLAACPNGRHAASARARLASGLEPLEPELVHLRGGCFRMGSPATERPRDTDEREHQACVDDFAIGRFEVTFDEFDRFVAATGREAPYDEGWGRGRQPVINVSWEEAVAYARWLAQRTGRAYRLPTEAEWEFACRSGGQAQRFCGAERVNPLGCYADNCQGRAHPVGSRPANGLGIHDMSGNVGEWTCSAYDPRYRGSEKACARTGEPGSVVGRGGSWLDAEEYLRAASRDGSHKAFRAITLGFRLVLESGPCQRLADANGPPGTC